MLPAQQIHTLKLEYFVELSHRSNKFLNSSKDIDNMSPRYEAVLESISELIRVFFSEFESNRCEDEFENKFGVKKVECVVHEKRISRTNQPILFEQIVRSGPCPWAILGPI